MDIWSSEVGDSPPERLYFVCHVDTTRPPTRREGCFLGSRIDGLLRKLAVDLFSQLSAETPIDSCLFYEGCRLERLSLCSGGILDILCLGSDSARDALDN